MKQRFTLTTDVPETLIVTSAVILAMEQYGVPVPPGADQHRVLLGELFDELGTEACIHFAANLSRLGEVALEDHDRP